MCAIWQNYRQNTSSSIEPKATVKTDERSSRNILAGRVGFAPVGVADVFGDLFKSGSVIFWRTRGDSKKQPDAFTANGAKRGQAKPVRDGGLQDGYCSGFTQIVQVSADLPGVPDKPGIFTAGKHARPCRIGEHELGRPLRVTLRWQGTHLGNRLAPRTRLNTAQHFARSARFQQIGMAHVQTKRYFIVTIQSENRFGDFISRLLL